MGDAGDVETVTRRIAPRKTVERKTTERKTTERRLGRPPDTDSGETRDRIVSIARERFAELGFEMATNREIANRSGVTPAALYHYFGSKLDLYLAVHEHTQDLVYSRFENCVRGHDTFVAQFSAILDEAHDMNRVDHSVARFLGAVRVDVIRHPEMRVSVEPRSRQRESFFAGIVDVGIATGEIHPERRATVLAYILTVLIGLTDAVSGDIAAQGRAIEAIKATLPALLEAR